jgi:hypothetical protein
MSFRADVLQLAHSPDGSYEQSLDQLNQLAAEHLKAKHPGMSA